MRRILYRIKSFCRRLKGLFNRNNNSQDLQVTLLAPIEEQLAFEPSRHLTLGVEFELGVVELEKHEIVPDAASIIEALNSPRAHPEAAAHILEITTGICSNVQDAEIELSDLVKRAESIAKDKGLALCGTGYMTLFQTKDIRLNEGGRYDILNERRQHLYRHFNSMQGMHIHLGMRTAEECIRNHNFFVHFLPHILALSASTPIENHEDTGLDSIRASIAEALPIAGQPYHFATWQEYRNLCLAMENADSICSLKDINVDLRPCPRFGTLEIRIADQPATMAESMAIVAFVHNLAEWFEENYDWLDEMHRPSEWRMRDNKWRAMRYGLAADLIINNQGETRSLKEDILNWVNRLEPYAKRHKYGDYMNTIRQMVSRGNSSQRQRQVLKASKSLTALADFNLREWQNGTPLWNEVDELQEGKTLHRNILLFAA